MPNASKTQSVATDQHEPGLSSQEGEFSQRIGERDVYVSECPTWCHAQHPATQFEEDRAHSGPCYFLPVRSFGGQYFDGEIFGNDLAVALQQPALYRNPRVRMERPGDSGFTVFLSLHEAGLLAEALQSLVTEADGIAQ